MPPRDELKSHIKHEANLPDLANASDRERLSASAIKGFVNIAIKWMLTDEQTRALLGGVDAAIYRQWEADPAAAVLDQATLTRISLMIGIFKALHNYFGQPWADQWVTLGNRGPFFGGQAPIDYMIAHGASGMLEVRLMLQRWCLGIEENSVDE
jgi:hypothetical protein